MPVAWEDVIELPSWGKLNMLEQVRMRQQWYDEDFTPFAKSRGVSDKELKEQREYEILNFDNGTGKIATFTKSALQGLGTMFTSAVQGAGALTGLEGMEEAGASGTRYLQNELVTDPRAEFTNTAGSAIGSAGAFIGTAGAAGLVGKGLGAVGTAQKVGALGTAFLAGAGEGATRADQLGITGADKYLRTVEGGVIEAGSEVFPFGLGTEMSLLRRGAGSTIARAIGTESVEEFNAQVGGNIADIQLAPPGVKTPAVLEGAGMAAFGGAFAGGAMGVAKVLISPTAAAAQTAQQSGMDGPAQILAEVAAVADARIAETAPGSTLTTEEFDALSPELPVITAPAPPTTPTANEEDQRQREAQLLNEGSVVAPSAEVVPASPAEVALQPETSRITQGRQLLADLAQASAQNDSRVAAEAVIDGTFNGTFRGPGNLTLEVDENGNVVLRRFAEDRKHMIKEGQTSSGAKDLMDTSEYQGGGNGVPTIGSQRGGAGVPANAYANYATEGVFRIPAEEFKKLSQEGEITLGNIGESEIVISPAVAAKYLSELIDRKTGTAVGPQIKPAASSTLSEEEYRQVSQFLINNPQADVAAVQRQTKLGFQRAAEAVERFRSEWQVQNQPPVTTSDIAAGTQMPAADQRRFPQMDLNESRRRVRGEGPQFSERVAPFYSQLGRVVTDKLPNRASAQQIEAVLRNPQNRVREDEIKWSGLIPFLQGREGAVSKKEIQEFLQNEGAVRFEEVTAGIPVLPQEEKLLNDNGWSVTRDNLGRIFFSNEAWGEVTSNRVRDLAEFGEIPNPVAEAASKIDTANNKSSKTQYGQYQLPGGENYREVVLTMPPTVKRTPSITDWLEAKGISPWKMDQYMTQYLAEYPVDTANVQKRGWESHHFSGVQDYVAHMRLNEREDAQDRPGLFMEELQSDRGQTLRDGKEGVPDMPFRKSSEWGLQLFKRALRDAVAAGKQWIGWTSGKTQGERFDLSKQVDGILVDRTRQGNYIVKMKKPGGREWDDASDGPVNADKLADIIGKDLAQKAVDQINNADPNDVMGFRAVFEGDGLKTESAGMKGFYDKILPNEIGKYVKQWGGKVTQNTLPSGEKIWSVDITPEMQRSVSEGQPLFSPQSLNPQQYPTGTITPAVVQTALTNFRERIGAPLPQVVVLSKAEAAEQFPDVAVDPRFENGEGFYVDGQVVIMPDGIGLRPGETPESAATRVILHETAGHLGLRDALGKWGTEVESALNDLQRSVPALQGRTMAEVEEYFARQIENGGVPRTGVLKRVWDAIVNALRSIFGMDQIPNEEAVVRELLQRSLESLRSGVAAGQSSTAFSGQSTGLVTPQQDAAYMQAVEAGDTATAQAMVDEAAKAAGYTVGPVHHGTRNEFNEFEIEDSRRRDSGWLGKGFYFTFNGPEFAESFGPRVVSAYIKAPRIFDVRTSTIQDVITLINASRKQRGLEPLSAEKEIKIRTDWRDMTRREDWIQFDGPIPLKRESFIKDQGDPMAMARAAGYDAVRGAFEGALIVDDPAQIKSADPVTRDAAGNVIPLSQRFNPASNDIRFSERLPSRSRVQHRDQEWLPVASISIKEGFDEASALLDNISTDQYQSSRDGIEQVRSFLAGVVPDTELGRAMAGNPQMPLATLHAIVIRMSDAASKAAQGGTINNPWQFAESRTLVTRAMQLYQQFGQRPAQDLAQMRWHLAGTEGVPSFADYGPLLSVWGIEIQKALDTAIARSGEGGKPTDVAAAGNRGTEIAAGQLAAEIDVEEQLADLKENEPTRIVRERSRRIVASLVPLPPPVRAEVRKLIDQHQRTPVVDFAQRLIDIGVAEDAARLLEVQMREIRVGKQQSDALGGYPRLKSLIDKMRGPGAPRWADIFKGLQGSSRDVERHLITQLQRSPAFANLPRDERLAVAEDLRNLFTELRRKAAAAEIKKLENRGKTDADRKKVDSAIPRIMQMLELGGVLTDETVAKAIAEKYGVKVMTPAEEARALSMWTEIRGLRGVLRRKKVRELVDFIARTTDVTTAEVVHDWTMRSILANGSTLMSILNGGLAEAMAMTFSVPMGRAVAAIGVGDFATAGRILLQMPRSIMHLMNGFMTGAYVMATGDTSMLSNFTDSAQSFMEEGRTVRGVERNQSLPIMDAYWRNMRKNTRWLSSGFLKKAGATWMEMAGRMIQSADIVARVVVQEIALDTLLAQENPDLLQRIRNPSAADKETAYKRAVGEIFGTTAVPSRFIAMQNPAVKARMTEILGFETASEAEREQLMRAEIVAEDIAKAANLQKDPQGLARPIYRVLTGAGGILDSALSKLGGNLKANATDMPPVVKQFFQILSFLSHYTGKSMSLILGTKFSRAVVGLATQAVRFIPVSAVGRSFVRSQYPELFDGQKNELLDAHWYSMNIVGAVAGLTLAGFANKDDDDEGWHIEGNWDWYSFDQQKKRRASGLEPLTAWKRNEDGSITKLGYGQFPFRVLFAAIGSQKDHRLGDPKTYDPGFLDRAIPIWSASGLGAIKDVAALDTFQRLISTNPFSSPEERELGLVKRVQESVAQTVTGIFPKALKDLDQALDANRYTDRQIWGNFIRGVPFARRTARDGQPDITLLGRPVEMSAAPWRRFYKEFVPKDDAEKVIFDLIARGIKVPAWDDVSKGLYVMLDDDNLPVKIPDQTAYNVSVEQGQALADILSSYDLSGDPETVTENLQSLASKAWQQVRRNNRVIHGKQ